MSTRRSLQLHVANEILGLYPFLSFFVFFFFSPFFFVTFSKCASCFGQFSPIYAGCAPKKVPLCCFCFYALEKNSPNCAQILANRCGCVGLTETKISVLACLVDVRFFGRSGSPGLTDGCLRSWEGWAC